MRRPYLVTQERPLFFPPLKRRMPRQPIAAGVSPWITFNQRHVLAVFLILALCVPLFPQGRAYQNALESYQSERYLEALAAIQKALGQDKHKASHYLLQAKILSALRQFSDAEESLRRAMELEPGWVEPYYELGVLLFRHSKFQKAAAMLAQGVEREPDSIKTRFLLGISYMQINLDGAAMEQFKAVERADPNYPAVHHSIGRVYFRQGRDNEAIERFKSELVNNPNHAAARFLLGKVLLRTGQEEEAVVHLLALQGKEVGQAQLQYFLGSAYSRLGKPAEAVEALLKSIALNPAFYESRYLLARLYLETGPARSGPKTNGHVREIAAERRAGKGGRRQKVRQGKSGIRSSRQRCQWQVDATRVRGLRQYSSEEF